MGTAFLLGRLDEVIDRLRRNRWGRLKPKADAIRARAEQLRIALGETRGKVAFAAMAGEIAERIQNRSALLVGTPVPELLAMDEEALRRIDDAEPGLAGAQRVGDDAVLLAAIGVTFAARALAAEDRFLRDPG